jgi:hypothetical protein
VSVADAEKAPARAVVGTVGAGCDPVRVTLANGDDAAWVTDRGADTLIALRLTPQSAKSVGHIVAAVRVGSNPVDVTLVDGASVALVTDSARYSAPNNDSTLAAVNTADALAGRGALMGYLPAGAFPRQFGRDNNGPLFFTNFNSMTMGVIDPTDIHWLETRQP